MRSLCRIQALAILLVATLVLGLCAEATGRPQVQRDKPRPTQDERQKLHLLDLEGRPIDPFGATNVQARVFIFVSNECPIANRYAPEIRRLHTQFASNSIPFWLVHADPDETPASIAKHMEEYEFTCGVLRDPRHLLVKRAKVRVTPEAAVFAPDGQLLYHGRIDNRYVDFGKARPAATQHELKSVLEAIVSGKPVPVKQTQAIGCYIPKL